jgi:hypothetical protein
VKTSLRYHWVQDRRDDRALPTRGTCLDVNAELAGLAGDVELAEVPLFIFISPVFALLPCVCALLSALCSLLSCVVFAFRCLPFAL